jgi:hypothetical protein
MTTILRRLRAAGLACVIATGSGGVVAATSSFLTAGPALASSPCTDYTTAQPTAVHNEPSDSSRTLVFLNTGTQVSGNCVYQNNKGEGRWYMTVDAGGGGYIWIQRLSFGQIHQCDKNGTPYGIGSSQCPLY